jgi:hypothetical protein
VFDFIVGNHIEDKKDLVFKDFQDMMDKYGDCDLFSLQDEFGIETLSIVKISGIVGLEVLPTIVRLDCDKDKLTKELSVFIENTLHSGGIKKLIRYISVKDKESVTNAIERNFIVEGLLRNFNGAGKDSYILGKDL